MRRRPTIELLDTDAGTPAEVEGSLQDLRWFNRWFGGISTVRRLIETVVQKTSRRELSILDVAAGDAFIWEQLTAEFEARGISLRPTLLDRSALHLPRNGSAPKIAADALRLPFRDSSFDLASSSLFVHHLSPEEAKRFTDEALRVCRLAVLVHDLRRHPLHLAFAYAGVPLYRSRLTRNDAPASVWQAYTLDEMRGCFPSLETVQVETHEHFFYRMGVIAWKQPA
jgi:ubiquinone/menaquinone biosynthesis C-methylase UbiE